MSFSILLVGQSGRVGYEAALFLASLRANDPGFSGRVVVAEPQPGPRWQKNPRMPEALHALLARLGAEVMPFASNVFGQAYPQGNKIEALPLLGDAPFLFFDSDTVVTGALSALSLDLSYPCASMLREDTWPKPALYGPDRPAIWKALYDRFGLDFATSQDTQFAAAHWQRYLYFNAGWFLGDDASAFGEAFLEIARGIRDDPPPELASQTLDPWLDQVALPLAVHRLGGGRPKGDAVRIDGGVTRHYRALPLFYAKANDAEIDALEALVAPHPIRKVLRDHMPFRKMLYQGQGRLVRNLFDGAPLPELEKPVRQRIKQAGLWMR